MRSGRSSAELTKVDQCAEQGDGNQGRKYRLIFIFPSILLQAETMCSHSRQDGYNAGVLLGQPSRPLAYLIRLFPVIPSCAGMSSIETDDRSRGKPVNRLGRFHRIWLQK